MTNGLTRSQLTRKNQLIEQVKSGLCTFLDVGRALLALQEEKLYADTHKTFERFMADEFGLKKRMGYYYIQAAKVQQNLCTIVHKSDMPTTENQYRELLKAPPEKLPEVIARVAERTERSGKTATAKDFKAAVSLVLDGEVLKPENLGAADTEELEEFPEDETIEEVCKREASEVESWARQIGKLLNDAQEALELVPTLDELNARTGWERKLKEALATLRNTKPVVCPMCQGDGDRRCPCKGHGRVTKQQYKQMV